jgi:hypothetical protein
MPPFHVILKPTWPDCEPGGGDFVVDPVPPSLNAVGVHDANFDPTLLPLSGPEVTLAHVTFDGSGAAGADSASGRTNPVAEMAVAATSAPNLDDRFTIPSPLIGMTFPS